MATQLTPEIAITLINQGLTQAEIARLFGVTRQYVNILAKRGGREPITPRVTANLPWEVDPAYYSNTLYGALRLLGSYQLDPTSIRGSSIGKLNAFLRKIELFSQVLDYDPEYPAIPGYSNTPGFAFKPREETDEDFVVKIRPGATITPLGDKLWRMPKEWPKEP